METASRIARCMAACTRTSEGRRLRGRPSRLFEAQTRRPQLIFHEFASIFVATNIGKRKSAIIKALAALCVCSFDGHTASTHNRQPMTTNTDITTTTANDVSARNNNNYNNNNNGGLLVCVWEPEAARLCTTMALRGRANTIRSSSPRGS